MGKAGEYSMNGVSGRLSYRRRQQQLTRVLLIAAVALLFLGLFGQITLRARISSQAKQLASVQAEIRTLDAHAQNLDLNINQRHNLAEIGTRAVQLGMLQADETQLRVVNLPAMSEYHSTQTVDNSGAGRISG